MEVAGCQNYLRSGHDNSHGGRNIPQNTPHSTEHRTQRNRTQNTKKQNIEHKETEHRTHNTERPKEHRTEHRTQNTKKQNTEHRTQNKHAVVGWIVKGDQAVLGERYHNFYHGPCKQSKLPFCILFSGFEEVLNSIWCDINDEVM